MTGSIEGQVPAGGPPPVPDAGSPAPSLFARFGRLFSAPRTAFQPPLGHSVWIAAFLVLGALQVTQGILLRDLVREQMLTGISQNDRIPEEQRERFIDQMEESYADPGKYALQQVWGVAGGWILGYLIPALIYLGVMNFVFGARASFREILGVTAFSNLIILVRELIRLPLMLSRETLFVFISPAAFVDPANRALTTLLDRFDLFTLYRLGLLAFGLAAISGVKASRTAVPVVILWLLVGLISFGFMMSPLGRMFG